MARSGAELFWEQNYTGLTFAGLLLAVFGLPGGLLLATSAEQRALSAACFETWLLPSDFPMCVVGVQAGVDYNKEVKQRQYWTFLCFAEKRAFTKVQ